jgi:hypothetical protein
VLPVEGEPPIEPGGAEHGPLTEAERRVLAQARGLDRLDAETGEPLNPSARHPRAARGAPAVRGSLSATPPIERWAEDGALRELARLARDLPKVDADEAWRRRGRLTEAQRAVVIDALGRRLQA